MNTYKVIIAGGRDFSDYDFMFKSLSEVFRGKYEPDEIVSGMASGADALGVVIAKEQGVPVKPFPADWSTHNPEMCDGTCSGSRKARPYCSNAGHYRNQKMADYADALVAFWDGKSRGTLDMINRMQNADKPVFIFKYNQ